MTSHFFFRNWRETANSFAHFSSHFRSGFLALCVVLIPLGAHAADTPASLRAEAKTFLASCSGLHGAALGFCRADHNNFVMDYECAFSGSYWSEKNVADDLSWRTHPGIQSVDLLSCAWATVVVATNGLATSADVHAIASDCSHMNHPARRAAVLKARLIAARIAAFRATPGARSVCP
ncbi:MAG: hypothetical protein KGK10_06970 [Rhodospirillales bacterium]|nr:hypothetical protein [Rhodospirillales bacterium]